MSALSLQHVSLWLQDGPVGETTFAHSLEWAFRLELPLRVTAIADPLVTEKLKVLGQAAARRGVTPEIRLTAEGNQRTVDQFYRANGLCVIPESTLAPIGRDMTRPMSPAQNICQLLCSPAFTPIERVLVLCRDVDLREHYLESAAKICHTLETTPVILILAGSEYDAELKREYAEGVFHARRMVADVDMVIDRDPIVAVHRVVSWRRCSHVIMPWRSDALNQFAQEVSQSASVLIIPCGATLDMPLRIGRGAALAPFNQPNYTPPITAHV